MRKVERRAHDESLASTRECTADAAETPAPQIEDAQPAAAAGVMTRYLTGPGDEDPYRLHAGLQELMHEDVGIFRTWGR